MKREKIYAVIEQYGERLRAEHVIPKRIPTNQTFKDCSVDEVLSHAHYLVVVFRTFDAKEQYGKLNRHLAAIQMLLSFAGWYTLRDIMEHNRP